MKKLITIHCNKCGANSIYQTEGLELKDLICKGCKSEDVKVIKNPGE
jgi:Zn finger protein HypA/HybF involved in hydrogenase expression